MKTTMTDARAGKRGARRGAWTLNAHCMTGIVAMICSLALAFGSCLLTMMPLTAVADDDLPETGSITAVYKNENVPVAGVGVKLYHVADWGDNAFLPTSDFTNAKVSWDIFDAKADQYRQLAETLSAYIAANGIDTPSSGETGPDGSVVFTNLSKALYLVVFNGYSDGTLTCRTAASLISLPATVDNNDGSTSQQMDVTMYAKSSCSTTPTPPTETVKRKVVKVWKNDSDKVRPKKIVVQLLQDGKVYDEVELNESNNWTYEWTDLPAGHDWQVVEKTVPDDYTVLVDRENDVLTITNTYTPPSTPPTTPPETPPTTPPTTPPDTPGTPPDTPGTPPSNNTPPTSTTTTNKPPIGNTGAAIILPAAAAAVLVSVAIIILMRRRSRC